MLNYYQPFLLPFLRTKRYTLPPGLERKYFISFEDALWNTLPSLGIHKKSVILLPNFYCMDVVQNIRAHGYTVVLYPLDKHFQIHKKLLRTFIITYKPSAIILFHSCGIPNKIARDRHFIQATAKHALVIEDAVQSLLNPETIQIYHTNHIVIDSLRKVLPLHGSFIYGKSATISRIQPAEKAEYGYVLFTAIHLLAFRLLFIAGYICRSPGLIRFAHSTALKKHDDLIGDSTEGHLGPKFVPYLHSFISFGKIEAVKEKQCFYYVSRLLKIYNGQNLFYPIALHPDNYRYLHVYPVGYVQKNSGDTSRIDEYLRKHNIPVWSKFPDCPWSKYRGVLFLPLGFHVRYNEIDTICRLLLSYRHAYNTKNIKQKRTPHPIYKRGV